MKCERLADLKCPRVPSRVTDGGGPHATRALGWSGISCCDLPHLDGVKWRGRRVALARTLTTSRLPNTVLGSSRLRAGLRQSSGGSAHA